MTSPRASLFRDEQGRVLPSFSFIPDPKERAALCKAYACMLQEGLLEWFQTYMPSSSSSSALDQTHPNIQRMGSALADQGVHLSGDAFIKTMDGMHVIARHGLIQYAVLRDANPSQTAPRLPEARLPWPESQSSRERRTQHSLPTIPLPLWDRS
jgi:hypothetical protein